MKRVLFILGELNDTDIDWLIAAGRREQIPTHAALIHEGKPADKLYILLEGKLAVTVAALGEKVIATLAAGEVVGEMSFIDAYPPSATVKAVEPAWVLSVSRSILMQKLQQDVGFASRFYRALAMLLSHRLRGTVKQMGNGKSNGLNTDMASTVALAEARFDALLKRLQHSTT
ncbi:MAG: cyclic nucleotide-binding domain-containing protein [Cyanothece sp. SIO1E1]|nr:cyclic nucleotide-binding domain-containing protein [Cyanothece sp. SIO1E1]